MAFVIHLRCPVAFLTSHLIKVSVLQTMQGQVSCCSNSLFPETGLKLIMVRHSTVSKRPRLIVKGDFFSCKEFGY